MFITTTIHARTTATMPTAIRFHIMIQNQLDEVFVKLLSAPLDHQALFLLSRSSFYKRKNHGRGIISKRLLSEYAYILKPCGHWYCITDVKELYEWHVQKCDKHPLFRRLDETEMGADPCVEAMRNETEEGKKVE
jgi:hypothetical protein